MKNYTMTMEQFETAENNTAKALSILDLLAMVKHEHLSQDTVTVASMMAHELLLEAKKIYDKVGTKESGNEE